MRIDDSKFMNKDKLKEKKKNINYDRDGAVLGEHADASEVCAQYVKCENRDIYYIKQDSMRNLYNPTEIGINKRGNLIMKIKTVSEECFMRYLKFLKNKNQKDYNLANKVAIR